MGRLWVSSIHNKAWGPKVWLQKYYLLWRNVSNYNYLDSYDSSFFNVAQMTWHLCSYKGILSPPPLSASTMKPHPIFLVFLSCFFLLFLFLNDIYQLCEICFPMQPSLGQVFCYPGPNMALLTIFSKSNWLPLPLAVLSFQVLTLSSLGTVSDLQTHAKLI